MDNEKKQKYEADNIHGTLATVPGWPPAFIATGPTAKLIVGIEGVIKEVKRRGPLGITLDVDKEGTTNSGYFKGENPFLVEKIFRILDRNKGKPLEEAHNTEINPAAE